MMGKLMSTYADVEIGSLYQIVHFKLDTGATANVIPARIFKKLFKQVSRAPPTSSLSGYGGEKLDIKGTCQLKCKWKDIHTTLTFDIVEQQHPLF